ncbi:hypothetical protein GCM10009662_54220 [Catellatospora coxensis]|uniref:Uncharacterized protein n=1 Tax=Catellatospora coxensis TaxID=310354 RepID=A0A8J3L0L9_9ACTN|nr:hypothetical protein Cco03nite_57290 [Catellatospora coxensis]
MRVVADERAQRLQRGFVAAFLRTVEQPGQVLLALVEVAVHECALIRVHPATVVPAATAGAARCCPGATGSPASPAGNRHVAPSGRMTA